jgi:hypothetical protein
MIALSLVLALAAPAAVKDDAAPDIPAALRVRWTQHFEAVRDFLYVTDDGQVRRLPGQMQDLFEASRKRRAARLDSLEDQIKRLNRTIADSRQGTGATRDERYERRKLLQAQVKKLDAERLELVKDDRADRTSDVRVEPTNRLPLEVGGVGKLSGVEVLQVVDDDEMMVEYAETRLWLEGISTEGIADGVAGDLPGVYLITGTKRYETAIGGLKTVFVAKRFAVHQYLRKPTAAQFLKFTTGAGYPPAEFVRLGDDAKRREPKLYRETLAGSLAPG